MLSILKSTKNVYQLMGVLGLLICFSTFFGLIAVSGYYSYELKKSQDDKNQCFNIIMKMNAEEKKQNFGENFYKNNKETIKLDEEECLSSKNEHREIFLFLYDFGLIWWFICIIFISVFFMVFGFSKWYRLTQVPSDRLLQADLEIKELIIKKLKKELNSKNCFSYKRNKANSC